jgi:predicted dehydrogenase
VIPDFKDVDVVAYVDTDSEDLDLLRQEAGVAPERCFKSLHEALAEALPEAALITTALASHAPLARAALEAGLHVLIEKPFAPSLSAAQELVDMAAARNLVLMVSQNYRFFPAPRAIAAQVRDSELGRLFQISIDFRRYSPPRPDRRGRHHQEEQPLLVDMSIHHFDLLRMILNDEPDRIYCDAWNPGWTAFAGPSVAVATIDFDDVVVSYRGSWVSAGPITPWAGEWRLEFERGEIFWTNRNDDAANDRVVVKQRGSRVRTLRLQALPWTGMWGTLAEFVHALRTGREPETSGRKNLGTIAFVDAAVESAARREPVVMSRNDQALAI